MRTPSFIVCLLLSFLGRSQVSPFNGLSIDNIVDSSSYRLVISGHFHGSGKDRSGYPAATLLANIDRINSLQASAILSTGDLFLEPEKEHQQFQRSFLSKLNAPIFNVPGNHDKGGYYDEHFGPTYSSFMIGEDAFILLDTEQKDGSLDKDQLQLLEELEQKDVRNIFILSHRPIWSEGDKRYGPLFEGNTRSVVGTNFKQAVFPLVQELAKSSPVFWISGSTAGNAPTSFFFQEHEQNIFYIQSAIRNSEWDALLVADVSADGIRWSSLSLTDRTATDPRSFNADWWWQQRGGKKPFNYRLIPYYVKSAALEPLFWYGAVVGLLLFALVRLVLRRVL